MPDPAAAPCPARQAPGFMAGSAPPPTLPEPRFDDAVFRRGRPGRTTWCPWEFTLDVFLKTWYQDLFVELVKWWV